MPIAKITGQGLAAIAMSVALLWGCLIVEHLKRQSAFTERIEVMRQIQMLQRKVRPLPVSTPLPWAPYRPHVTAG